MYIEVDKKEEVVNTSVWSHPTEIKLFKISKM